VRRDCVLSAGPRERPEWFALVGFIPQYSPRSRTGGPTMKNAPAASTASATET
jgi:hypothetical protein